MSTGKEQLDVEDDVVGAESDDEAAETPVEVAKTNLSKRRTIDNLLEERRLQKQLADYDFDL
ncbi:hypothetical protein P0D91_26500 [Pseudomonas sp. CBSPBW29]|jgi:hypothetical protein|uniref:Uncharacterized protein n=1 Tax=Pseudomonas yamanorum TaxID=515393 RepID=A0A143GBX4_9PSED|nr:MULTISPECIES: hypothetical protein [Pseudomonas]WEL41654.1 hypothetical protein P0D91_26500 [Pseudomonas sp. CBSPBW29]WEL62715.1 hypothetical protein P0D93_20675 [Pseudomonas sp. CBSPGW29]WEL71903.1 hypothetical protein P0D94_06615 [Pseudomonas sp. CBSPCGW29]WEL78804.1 hypothetical protein P0D92_12600 [Pseudomonas sp. CBSPAW29]WEL82546.1 hypothetical protein P0D95_33195 [Pseudomonas sp. CBSPCAW29]WEL91019.1 hypothetical protein P0D90_15485 [Pseudomonas sp. CBSPCBW29]